MKNRGGTFSPKKSQSDIKTKSFPKLHGPEYPETIKWVLLEGPAAGRYIVGVAGTGR